MIHAVFIAQRDPLAVVSGILIWLPAQMTPRNYTCYARPWILFGFIVKLELIFLSLRYSTVTTCFLVSSAVRISLI